MFLHKSRYAVTFLLFLVISFGCSKKSEGLVQNDMPYLVNGFLQMHVSINDYTDEISARTLDNIISNLDPWKMYFTKSDIDKIMKDKDKLDDYFYANNYQFLFAIYELYKTRFDERYSLYTELMKQDFDFTANESITADKDKILFTDDLKEIRDRWRKTIKLQLLGYVNTGKSIEDAKKKVSKKYELAKKDTEALSADKIYKSYINSFGLALDPHSDYMDRYEFEDFKIQMSLKLQGIGAVLRSEDGYVFVESIMPGGPVSKLPEELKIMPNDKIIAVAQGDKEPEEIIDIPLRDAVKKIRGDKGTTVNLTIVREIEKGKPRQLIIPIVRDEIVLEQQAVKSEIYEKKQNGTAVRIGYIKLPTFYSGDSSFGSDSPRTSSSDMLDAIKDLSRKKVNAMVVDLRENPGGALEDAINISGFFIKDGPVVQVMEHGNVSVKRDTDSSIYYDGPVVILIDKLSASASEIVSGAMKD
ncbi:MAG: S41 family peptidase, partial [Spirochaetota bacterium]